VVSGKFGISYAVQSINYLHPFHEFSTTTATTTTIIQQKFPTVCSLNSITVMLLP
jgi:hypothetical protein